MSIVRGGLFRNTNANGSGEFGRPVFSFGASPKPADMQSKKKDTQIKSVTTTKAPSFMSPQDMVTVKITPLPDSPEEQDSDSETLDITTLVIHKRFIVHHSEYFKAAFEGKFKEGLTQTMNLEDVDPESFALIVGWIHTGRVKDDTGDTKTECSDLSVLATIWVLADRFLMPKLQSCIVQLFIVQIKKANYDGFATLFEKAYEVNNGDNSLQRAAVYVTVGMKEDTFLSLMDSLSSQDGKISLEIAKALRTNAETNFLAYWGPQELHHVFGLD